MQFFHGFRKFPRCLQNRKCKATILYDYQSGFRKNHSTDTCLSFLNDKILKGFDDGLVTGMILIDLQKAFDTINHDIQLKKLSIIGFSDHTVK